MIAFPSNAANDADAGKWQMIVLTDPAQIPVPAPTPVTDPAYQAELAAVKAAQAQMATGQSKAISYWSAGGVVRWNEIVLELVASTDLPPEPNPDGSYPAPDANNPFAIPRYPFSNPPYAARAYSYIAVAQFEALKVAWYYKYLYNRPAPYKVDNGILAIGSVSDIPAYPSEDAVEAGVAVAILKLLFPTGASLVAQKANEQQQVARLTGRATPSDIAAGYALGQAVAAEIIARAGADGMRAAAGTPAQWQALADATAARGEIPWKSQEIPPRPPMLPFFGNVKAWMMTPADIVAERPGPPPSTSSAQMAKETEEVRQTVEHLTRNQLAIATRWADGVSSPTPPGHWNFIAESYIGKAQYSEVRAARAFALLNMALHDAAVACWDTKYYYFNPRPVQMDRRIKTVIGLPNFPAYTSGHSAFSAAAATVLSYLFPSGAEYFSAQTDEAAISRLYGAIHYRADIDVGKDQGRRVGGYTVRFAQKDGADSPRTSTTTSIQTLDGASYRSPVAPGSIASVFQNDLVPALNLANTVPLPTSLGGLSMKFNGTIAVPFYAASPSQANIQIPWELEGHTSATLTATNASGSVVTFSVPLSGFAPAIFSVNQRGSGQGIITLANSTTVAAPSESVDGLKTRPAKKGEYITIYCVGLGAVNNPPATGAVTPDATSTAKSPVSVVLNGTSIAASFAGLSPGSVGLFQVNVQIPDTAPAGNAVTLAVSVGGAISNTVTIAIQ
jgi:uncharacterized protein (TIGR03437 family)